jgi:glycosyltransferase involved in cell wall biosynthesis
VHLTDFWYLCPRFTLLRSDGALCAGPPDGGRGCVSCEYPELAGRLPEASSAANTPGARLRALLDRPTRQLENLAKADAVFAPSEFLASMFTKNGFPRDRLRIVPYGLEPGRIVPIPAARPRSPLRLAFCGVLSPWKAPHLVVDAVLGTTADVTLAVHGRTNEPMFQQYIDPIVARAAGDVRITFPGPYAATDAPRVFADMDVLVVPSTWYENTPFVVLEAFEAGVPVIASDLGGLAEVVRDGENGLLFEAGSIAALRAAIQRIAGDPRWFAGLRIEPPRAISASYDAFAEAYVG